MKITINLVLISPGIIEEFNVMNRVFIHIFKADLLPIEIDQLHKYSSSVITVTRTVYVTRE